MEVNWLWSVTPEVEKLVQVSEVDGRGPTMVPAPEITPSAKL